MRATIKTTGLIVIGATVSVLMLGLPAVLLIPLVIGAVTLGSALGVPIRDTLSQMIRQDHDKEGLEGERVVLDVRAKDEAGDPRPR